MNKEIIVTTIDKFLTTCDANMDIRCGVYTSKDTLITHTWTEYITHCDHNHFLDIHDVKKLAGVISCYCINARCYKLVVSVYQYHNYKNVFLTNLHIPINPTFRYRTVELFRDLFSDNKVIQTNTTKELKDDQFTCYDNGPVIAEINIEQHLSGIFELLTKDEHTKDTMTLYLTFNKCDSSDVKDTLTSYTCSITLKQFKILIPFIAFRCIENTTSNIHICIKKDSEYEEY